MGVCWRCWGFVGGACGVAASGCPGATVPLVEMTLSQSHNHVGHFLITSNILPKLVDLTFVNVIWCFFAREKVDVRNVL